MAELELDINQRTWEWSLLQESGSQLQQIYGPGLTGMHNTGNSCYINSVMQVLLTIPHFADRYVSRLSLRLFHTRFYAVIFMFFILKQFSYPFHTCLSCVLSCPENLILCNIIIASILFI